MLSLVVVALVAAAIPAARFVQDYREERSIPDVTAPEYRSAEFTEVFLDAVADGRARTEVVALADAVDKEVRVELISGAGISWRGDEDVWFEPMPDGSWIRYQNTEFDDQIFDKLMLIADGLTVEEVVPESSRRWVDVDSVERTDMLGDEVRHFTVQVDIHEMRRAQNGALEDFQQFWSDIDLDQFDALTVLELEFWVTDEGMVHQVRSAPGVALGEGSYVLTIDSASVDAPFDAELPTEFVDE